MGSCVLHDVECAFDVVRPSVLPSVPHTRSGLECEDPRERDVDRVFERPSVLRAEPFREDERPAEAGRRQLSRCVLVLHRRNVRRERCVQDIFNGLKGQQL